MPISYARVQNINNLKKAKQRLSKKYSSDKQAVHRPPDKSSNVYDSKRSNDTKCSNSQPRKEKNKVSDIPVDTSTVLKRMQASLSSLAGKDYVKLQLISIVQLRDQV